MVALVATAIVLLGLVIDVRTFNSRSAIGWRVTCPAHTVADIDPTDDPVNIENLHAFE